MRKMLLLLFGLFALSTSQAQSASHYEPLQSVGTYPADCTYYIDKEADKEKCVCKYLIESKLFVRDFSMNAYSYANGMSIVQQNSLPNFRK